MVCNNCGNNMDDNSKFCNNCGSVVSETNVTEKKNNEKKGIIFIIVGIILVVFIGVVLLLCFLSKDFTEKGEHNNSGNSEANLSGVVVKEEADGDYAKYVLSIDNVDYSSKYNFKVGNKDVLIEFREDDYPVWTTYVEGNKVLDDASLISELDYPFEMVVYELGDYLILTNHDFTYVKSERIYVVDGSGKLVNTLYDMSGDCLIYSNDFEINKDGITLIADRRATTEENVCITKIDESNYAWDNDDVYLCDRSSWPEGFGDTIYKAAYHFRYHDGILDEVGSIIDGMTVNEYVNSEDFINYYCTE